MNVAVVVVQTESDVGFVDYLFPGLPAILTPVIDPGLRQNACLPGVRVGVFRVQRDGAIEHALRFRVVFPRRAMVQYLARQHVFVGSHALRGLALRAIVAGRFDPAGERADDRAAHLVLDGEDVLDLAVVALGPDVPVGLGIDQLHGDSDTVAGFANAPLDDIVNSELARDVLDLDRPALVHERRVSGDNQEIAEPGQLGDDVLGEAVDEELLFGIAAHVDEGQHHQGRLRGRA